MRAADLRARLRQQPFKPFSIRLTDGIVHEVRHPKGVFVTAHNVIVGIQQEQRPGDYHDYALVTLLHVVQIDPISDMPEPVPSGIDGVDFS